MRIEKRNAVILLVATLLLGIIAISGGRAEASTFKWRTSSVCVKSTVPARWDVRGAVSRWNSLNGGPNLYVRESCAGARSKIIVIRKNSNDDYTGRTTWRAGTPTVELNPVWVERGGYDGYEGCVRSYTSAHEIGHALGLEHYTSGNQGNVMAYQGWWKRCGSLGSVDRRDYARNYGG